MLYFLQLDDEVTLKSAADLFMLFNRRMFFKDRKTRKKIAKELGGKSGVVSSVEFKYAFDYFYFAPNGIDQTYSIPYQAVNISLIRSDQVNEYEG